MESVEQARLNVEKSIKEAVEWAESSEKRAFHAFEGRLWSLLLALGRALVVLFLVRQAHRPRAVLCLHEERQYQLDGMRTTLLGTLFGKVAFSRPVGRRLKWGRRAVDLPVDRELGLRGGFSLGVVLETVRLCAQMAFASARESFPASPRMGAESENDPADGGRGWPSCAFVPRASAAAGR